MFKWLTRGPRAPAQPNLPDAEQSLVIHPAPIPLSKLPSSPFLPLQDANSPDIREFVQRALDDASKTIDAGLPAANIEARKYPSKGSTATMELTHQIIPAQANDLRPGWEGPADHAWYTRCSQHDDCSEPGTANYREFVSFIKKDHAGNLRKRNPNLFKDPSVVDEWDCREFIFPGGWRNVTARVNAVIETHVFGPSRTYFILEITASRSMDVSSRALDENAVNTQRPSNDAILFAPQAVSPAQKPLVADLELDSDTETPRECFVVIQLPVQHKDLVTKITCPKWNVFGSYISVEYVAQITPEAAGEKPPKPQLEWKMVMSANPGHLMHVFLMKNWRIGLPRMLVGDVGKFFEFVNNKRRDGHRARPASLPRPRPRWRSLTYNKVFSL